MAEIVGQIFSLAKLINDKYEDKKDCKSLAKEI
jgi:hypothetical protein